MDCRFRGNDAAFEGVQELPSSFSVIFDEIFPVGHVRITGSRAGIYLGRGQLYIHRCTHWIPFLKR